MKVKELIKLLNLTDESGDMEVVLCDTDDDTETVTKQIVSVEVVDGSKPADEMETEAVVAILF
jgi:hypothetical protein